MGVGALGLGLGRCFRSRGLGRGGGLVGRWGGLVDSVALGRVGLDLGDGLHEYSLVYLMCGESNDVRIRTDEEAAAMGSTC